MWKIIKDKKQSNNLPNIIHTNNNTTNNPDTNTKIFETYVTFVYTLSRAFSSYHLHYSSFKKDVINFSCSFSVSEILDSINNLWFTIKTGLDQILEIIHWNCFYNLTQTIRYLFNLYYLKEFFLISWKLVLSIQFLSSVIDLS